MKKYYYSVKIKYIIRAKKMQLTLRSQSYAPRIFDHIYSDPSVSEKGIFVVSGQI